MKNIDTIYVARLVLGVLKEDLGGFFKPKEALKMVLAYILLGCFKFLLDSYYEPLLWFMIRQGGICN